MNIRTPQTNDLPALKLLWQEAFGDTLDFINTFFKTAFDCKRCFCATAAGQIVAALYWFDCTYHGKPVAYLYAIATAGAYRGHGICHELMEYTHKHLLKQGYAGAVLVPGSAALFDFYASMHYQTCCYMQELHYPSQADEKTTTFQAPSLVTPTHTEPTLHPMPLELPTFSLRPVSKAEYATLRKQLLPKDGIIQENICLDFLETQVQLFAGTNSILAVHIENDRLFAPELLGDSSVAEQIVPALNCKEGILRIPGKQKPFAMYLPLADNTLPLPGYLGLAFD